MIIFKATPRQVLQIIANAVNASDSCSIFDLDHPIEDKVYTHEDFKMERHGINVTTFGNRGVELQLLKWQDNWKVAAGGEPDPEHQTWADEYATYRKLLESVEGVEVLVEDLEDDDEEEDQ